MVTEDVFVIQIKIIVTDTGWGVFVFAQSIIESGIQMIVLSVDPDDVPGMTVFDPFFRIVPADGDNTPYTKGITEDLYGFGDSLADTDTMALKILFSR